MNVHTPRIVLSPSADPRSVGGEVGRGAGRRVASRTALANPRILLGVLMALAGIATACGEPTLAERGRRVYSQNCAICHNLDPTLPGPVGPEIAGSSAALIEARVMRAEYPPGYTPKRDTRQMVAMPFLEEDLPALEAYLAAP